MIYEVVKKDGEKIYTNRHDWWMNNRTTKEIHAIATDEQEMREYIQALAEMLGMDTGTLIRQIKQEYNPAYGLIQKIMIWIDPT